MSEPGAIALPALAVQQLEQLAARALTARSVRPLLGWRVAISAGRIRRINSVQAVEWRGGADLSAALSTVEAFYADHALPARFRLTAVSRPEGLDAILAARGYRIEAPSEVLIADVEAIAAMPGDHPVDLASAAPPPWLAVWLAEASALDATERRQMVERLPPGTVFALARTEGQPSGVGFTVVEGDWAGIFAMRTAPTVRRRGVAGAVLQALAGHAARAGACRLYLQVDQDATVARRLYARAGFTFAYGYHYRTRDRAPAP